jgi:hypothetical protein
LLGSSPIPCPALSISIHTMREGKDLLAGGYSFKAFWEAGCFIPVAHPNQLLGFGFICIQLAGVGDSDGHSSILSPRLRFPHFPAECLMHNPQSILWPMVSKSPPYMVGCDFLLGECWFAEILLT